MTKKEAENILMLLKHREEHFEREAKLKDEAGLYLEAVGFKLLRDGVFVARSDLEKHFRSIGIRLKFAGKS
jgi:hypothetical protein